MKEWNSFFVEIQETIDHLLDIECEIPFFRGHSNSNWKLLPSLYRKHRTNNFEANLYSDFRLDYGPLSSRKLSSWEILFEMRHAGLPTRLLDWTESFPVALFFALRNYKRNRRKPNPCIWILNPIELDEQASEDEEGGIYNVDTMGFQYDDAFLIPNSEERDYISKFPIPICGTRYGKRIFAQKSMYTLHGFNRVSIEKICPSCVTKIIIPTEALDQAKKFLITIGVHEYSVFPDLDGLGRFLSQRHNK